MARIDDPTNLKIGTWGWLPPLSAAEVNADYIADLMKPSVVVDESISIATWEKEIAWRRVNFQLGFIEEPTAVYDNWLEAVQHTLHRDMVNAEAMAKESAEIMDLCRRAYDVLLNAIASYDAVRSECVSIDEFKAMPVPGREDVAPWPTRSPDELLCTGCNHCGGLIVSDDERYASCRCCNNWGTVEEFAKAYDELPF